MPPMTKSRVLVIDDEAAIRESLRLILEYEQYECLGASSGPEGVDAVTRESPDVVLLDIKMPGQSGLETLAAIRTVDASVPIAMISGHGTVSDAMEATRLGAFDFIEKPFTSERVLVTLAKGLELHGLRQENRELKLAMESRYELIGESPALGKVLDQVQRAAPTNASVLLLGESGVGKELVARTIHRNSPRAPQRFVQVNCAAIPEELIESELFGHERGSFTGATDKQIGKFEQANLGTLFLDEVGDMSPKTQAKVLRALQEQEVERLGSARTIKVNVRVVAATNKHLEEMIQRGEFREDLFFRLNVIPITIPPLRERRADIPLLAARFARLAAQEHNLRPRRLSPEVIEVLARHPWRGNVRELRNVVERLVIMAEGEQVTASDVPLDIRGEAPVGPGGPAGLEAASEVGAGTVTLRSFKEAAERAFLVARLQAQQWNISKTAEDARHAPQQSLQETRAIWHQSGDRRVGGSMGRVPVDTVRALTSATMVML